MNVRSRNTQPAIGYMLSSQVVRAWAKIRWPGTGALVLEDSYNVLSITDNGSGDITVSWNSDFRASNYVTFGAVANQNSNDSYVTISANQATPQSTSDCRYTVVVGAAAADPNGQVHVIAIGS